MSEPRTNRVRSTAIKPGDLMEWRGVTFEVTQAVWDSPNATVRLRLAGFASEVRLDPYDQVSLIEVDAQAVPCEAEASQPKEVPMPIASQTVTCIVARSQFINMLAALYTCSPSGGGSATMSLVRILAAQADVSIESVEFQNLVVQYSENIVRDAVEFGAVVRVSP